MGKEDGEGFYSLFTPLTTKKVICFLFIIGISLFFYGLFNDFVADDPPQITQNPIIHSIQNITHFFEGGLFYMGPGQKLGGSFYRPLQTVHFSFIYTIFGPNVFMFHLPQVLLFITNACLLFLLFKQYFRKSLAFVLSVVFLVHPINSESAYYISATQEVLFLFFGLVAFWIIQKYRSQKALLFATLALFFGLLSKETAILFFLVIPLYLFLYQRKRLYSFLIYIGGALSIYAFLRLNALGIHPPVTNNAPIQDLTLIERIINIPAMIVFYIKTFFFPLEIASVYHWVYKTIDLQHFYIPLIIDLIFFGTLLFFAFKLRRKSSKSFVLYIFFFLWFLFGLLLHMQIIPLDHTVTTQWFYFPMIGLLGMIGILLEEFRINMKNKYIITFIVIVIILLSVRTFVRGFDWKDDFTLASQDVRVSKEAYSLEHQLSRIYVDRGEYELAKIHAERSIDIYPSVFNYTDLGNAYFSLRQYPEAKKAYLQAIKYGDNYATYDNYAALYINYGDPKEGIHMIKDVLANKYPTDARLWLYLAVLEYRLGNKSEAKEAMEQAYKFNSGIPEIIPIYSVIMNDQPLEYKIGK